MDENAKKLIMNMYSMESFLYKELNRASRDKDQSKVATLGPYAYVLAKILQRMNPAINKGEDFVFDKRAPGFVTYRGLSLSQTEVDKF